MNSACATWPAPPARARHRAFSGLVLAGHALAVLALWQLDVVQHAVREATPLMVRVVSPAPAPREVPQPVPPAPPRTLPPPLVLAVPPVELDRPTPPPVLAVQVVAPPPAPVPAPSATPAPAVHTPAPPPPAAPLKVAASQLRYLVEPPIEVPRASRRLREQGTVVVHVLVDVQGQPRDVRLARSSGFERLDQQALSAMRQARFVPCRADGQPVECEADAPFLYELE